MTARFLVGDVFDRMAELPDHSFDFIISSPPFLALRSYLPEGHVDKHLEIGSEATPAEFLDTMLALTAEWRRLLAPHGSIAIELGDTYAGSGGAGGDYGDQGLRDGQPKFGTNWARSGLLDKSLTGIPTLYAWSLAYGRNLLTGAPSPAGQWRIRNLKPWIRTNPPVGALGDKERPATSYITVACTGRDRWFDLDAVRMPLDQPNHPGHRRDLINRGAPGYHTGTDNTPKQIQNPGGAPPLDWWHQIDAIIDDELQARAGKLLTNNPQKPGDPMTPGRLGSGDGTNNSGKGRYTLGAQSVGARGWHIRRRLEAAGHLHTQDALDISPKGYAGAHYAVWPPELVRQLVDEMCPRRVCTQCGEPSRRLTEASYDAHGDVTQQNAENYAQGTQGQYRGAQGMKQGRATKNVTTLGWSDCGHNTWRPGRILDPFVGSGTTLAVASGMSRDSVGIDLDPRNAHLAEQRVGMFLDVDWGRYPPTTELPPDIVDVPVEDAL